MQMGNSYRGFIFFSSAAGTCIGIMEVHTNSSGNPNFNRLTGDIEGITITGSTAGERTISAAGYTHMMVLTISGSVEFGSAS